MNMNEFVKFECLSIVSYEYNMNVGDFLLLQKVDESISVTSLQTSDDTTELFRRQPDLLSKKLHSLCRVGLSRDRAVGWLLGTVDASEIWRENHLGWC